jgi:hypothetical protein
MFAREQLCAGANIIACFYYTKLYSEDAVEAFERTTSAIERSSKDGLPEGVAHTGTLGGP